MLVLRQVGGSGVLVLPMTYIFDEEPQRWRRLLEELGLPHYMPSSAGSNGAGSNGVSHGR